MNPTVKKYPRIQKGPKFFRRKCSVAKRSSLKSDPVIHLSKNLSLQSSHLWFLKIFALILSSLDPKI